MPDTGPLRGIVINVLPWARKNEHRLVGVRTMGFNLWGRRGSIWREVGFRCCLWCRRPKDTPQGFHPECKVVKNWFALGAPVPGPEVCARCGAGEHCRYPGRKSWGGRYEHDLGKLDYEHRVALSIAVDVAGADGWVRALMPGNLQWLCPDPCHKEKTARDRSTLAALRRNDWPGRIWDAYEADRVTQQELLTTLTGEHA